MLVADFAVVVVAIVETCLAHAVLHGARERQHPPTGIKWQSCGAAHQGQPYFWRRPAVGMRAARAGGMGAVSAIAAPPSSRQARTCGRARRFRVVAGATNGNASIRISRATMAAKMTSGGGELDKRGPEKWQKRLTGHSATKAIESTFS